MSTDIQFNPGNQPPAPAEFTPITTQAELDRIIGARLTRQNAQHAADRAKAEAHDALLAEVETLRAQLPDPLAAARTNALEVHKLPQSALTLLTGATPEAIDEQAVVLAQLARPSSRRDPGQGNRDAEKTGTRGEEEAQKRFGGKPEERHMRGDR